MKLVRLVLSPLSLGDLQNIQVNFVEDQLEMGSLSARI